MCSRYWKHVSVTPLPSVYLNLACSQAAKPGRIKKGINKEQNLTLCSGPKEPFNLFLVQFMNLKASVTYFMESIILDIMFKLCFLCGTSDTCRDKWTALSCKLCRK